MPPSLLVLRYLVEDRLPRLLLPVNERRGFGGRHRIRVTAESCELLLQFRIERNFPQVVADLVDDCFGRAYGRHQNSPASGLANAALPRCAQPTTHRGACPCCSDLPKLP